MIRYDGEPTEEIILKLIDEHKVVVEKYKKLDDYYKGDNEILKRKEKRDSKPNNKLAHGYPSYIVDMHHGYFIGNPVVYTSEHEKTMENLQDVLDYNDEQDENTELAKMASIKGKGYEVVYMDEESKIRFDEIPPEEMIIVWDVKMNPQINFAIRYFIYRDLLSGQKITKIEVYTKDKVLCYDLSDDGLVETEVKDHRFKQVPIVEYLNNSEAMGDFERVITLIDAYDKANSDTANDFEEFTDAMLCLVNLNATDDEDIEKLRKDKILLLDEEGQAYWLIKEINDAALENYKDRLNSDIHKFSKTPDMSDEQFSSNASGIAMAYKLLAMEQVATGKERKFKRALQKRLELILEIIGILGDKGDYRDIQMAFSRNSPVNIKEEVETAVMLRGFTSDSTALGQLPMVDNPEVELGKIEAERAAYVLDAIDNLEMTEDGQLALDVKDDKDVEEPR